MKITSKAIPRLFFSNTFWEKVTFSELFSESKGKNKQLTYSADKIISVATMSWKEASVDVREPYLKTYNFLKKGDIAFEGNKSKNFHSGRFVLNDLGDGIVSHVFVVFRPKINMDMNFWKYYIHDENVMGRILEKTTTKTTMMTSIVAKDFLKQKINIPALKEQKKIGLVISQVDNLIDLNKKKVDQLRNCKKLTLQRLFSVEWRFKGFSDPWEQRKLKELYQVYSGQTPSKKDPLNYSSTGTPWIRTTELNNYKIVSAQVFVSKAGLKGLHVLEKDSVLLAMYGGMNQIGRTGILTFPATINQALSAFEPNGYINPYFLLAELNVRVSEWKPLAASSRKDPNITKKDVENFMISYPSLEEQKEIASSYKLLSKLIVANEKKVDELKQLKKYLMQNMFV
ncbi:restriction endonuclease subunit S [Levilactobacillus lanxiensis]|uniref:Restriction endonuclease subunit S n=1 Tax=Levilactobacillus lanxiensis TaxID=2799568 RepID=A0ABW4D4G7_9LACO|nr:restriction endonuclease subunit S [Levilactobacillus lanxiensis]